MKALVTGSAGFVGWHVTQAFTDAGWEVHGVDIDDPFPAGPVDVVVSLAATANPADAIKHPARAYANSTRVMVDTMEYARRVGARVLHVSTNEAHPPVGPYGGAKACQEVICSTYPDVPTTVVVTQSLFGERQQPNKLVPTVIRRVLAGEPVPLQCTGTKYAARPFLYVKDLAGALRWLATAGNEAGVNNTLNHPAKRVNIGAEVTVSTADVTRILARGLGRIATIDPVQAGDRPGHELTVRPIGWDLFVPKVALTTPLTTALWTVADWYREHPEALVLSAYSAQ